MLILAQNLGKLNNFALSLLDMIELLNITEKTLVSLSQKFFLINGLMQCIFAWMTEIVQFLELCSAPVISYENMKWLSVPGIEHVPSCI